MDYYAIGQRIKEFRKKENMTQEQLADAVNISPSHMSHIETGITKLGLSVLVGIAKALNVHTDDLLFDQTNETTSDKWMQLGNDIASCTPAQADLIIDITKSTISSVKKYFL